MQKIRRNDQVVVLVGKDKGRQGKVTKITDRGVFVSGVNMVKRHTKPNPMLGRAAEIVSKEAPIAISNVAIVNGETGKADRIGFRFEKSDGETKTTSKAKKVRFYKSTGKVVES